MTSEKKSVGKRERGRFESEVTLDAAVDTQATVVVAAVAKSDGSILQATGSARLSPGDAFNARVGLDIATARALRALANKLDREHRRKGTLPKLPIVVNIDIPRPFQYFSPRPDRLSDLLDKLRESLTVKPFKGGFEVRTPGAEKPQVPDVHDVPLPAFTDAPDLSAEVIDVPEEFEEPQVSYPNGTVTQDTVNKLVRIKVKDTWHYVGVTNNLLESVSWRSDEDAKRSIDSGSSIILPYGRFPVGVAMTRHDSVAIESWEKTTESGWTYHTRYGGQYPSMCTDKDFEYELRDGTMVYSRYPDTMI